jgi:hypothetical protein
MRRNPVTEVAYQVIDSRHRIVNKRKIFKTEAAMRKYFDKLEKDGHLHQILGYRKNPILEILGTAAATGLGFGVGTKLLDKISEKWGKKKNPLYTKSGRLVVFPELLTTMRTWVNPKVRAEALEARKRYSDDLKAGHKDAAEYWRGQAGAYFTANPKEVDSRWRNPIKGRTTRTEKVGTGMAWGGILGLGAMLGFLIWVGTRKQE